MRSPLRRFFLALLLAWHALIAPALAAPTCCGDDAACCVAEGSACAACPVAQPVLPMVEQVRVRVERESFPPYRPDADVPVPVSPPWRPPDRA